jgi:hypothetical protein
MYYCYYFRRYNHYLLLMNVLIILFPIIKKKMNKFTNIFNNSFVIYQKIILGTIEI